MNLFDLPTEAGAPRPRRRGGAVQPHADGVPSDPAAEMTARDGRGQPARGLADVLDELLESQKLDRMKVAIDGITR